MNMEDPTKNSEEDLFVDSILKSLKSAEFENRRKSVEQAMTDLLGKTAHVADFRHLEGNKYEFLIEVEDGDEVRQIVDFPG